MPDMKYKPEFVVEAYLAAKSGMTNNQISKILGVSLHTLNAWRVKKKAFRSALKRGRSEHKDNQNNTLSFRDYVFGHLSYKNRKLWKKINKLSKPGKKRKKDYIEQIEILLEKRGQLARQSMFMYAWVSSNFSISMALRKVNISRSTFEYWKQSKDFLELFKEMEWHKKNFFEEYLCKLVRRGNAPATIYANKTFNRDRGYGEKIEVDMNLSGELDQNVIQVDTLNLSLDLRKVLLASRREQMKKDRAKNLKA